MTCGAPMLLTVQQSPLGSHARDQQYGMKPRTESARKVCHHFRTEQWGLRIPRESMTGPEYGRRSPKTLSACRVNSSQKLTHFTGTNLIVPLLYGGQCVVQPWEVSSDCPIFPRIAPRNFQCNELWNSSLNHDAKCLLSQAGSNRLVVALKRISFVVHWRTSNTQIKC